MSDKKLASEVESMDPGALSRVNDFVDDDLLSCFMWAAGENAVAAARRNMRITRQCTRCSISAPAA